MKARVVDRRGIYFTLRRYRKRIGLLFGTLAFFAIIVLMSNFVWNISITGNSAVGRYRILEQLNVSGIRAGAHVESFDANQAELELTLAVDELAWVSIERSGSRINVKVSERLEGQRDPDTIPLSQPANVVVSRSGRLVKAEVYSGELLYEVDSGVNAGDVVVSGVVSDGAEGLLHVHADAKLFVEVTEIVDFYQPHTTFHRKKNGHSKTNRTIVFLGMRLGGELDISRYSHAEHIDYTETMTAPRFLGFPLPFRVLRQKYTFHDRAEVTDSPAAAREKLDRQIELFETNFLKDEGAKIIDSQVEFFPDDGGIGALIRYVFVVNAAQKQEISIGGTIDAPA